VYSRSQFADDLDMTILFRDMELEAEANVHSPETFFDYVHAMEKVCVFACGFDE
jgi:hypothetical protein